MAIKHYNVDAQLKERYFFHLGQGLRSIQRFISFLQEVEAKDSPTFQKDPAGCGCGRTGGAPMALSNNGCLPLRRPCVSVFGDQGSPWVVAEVPPKFKIIFELEMGFF
ncbi:hypothetical protein CEXT_639441 [Caerostris extrusa]|uniref:Uncharacterized protein n=1 Tax=Caerostris extrusa TaxID=172846 RepID=A0AAV4QP92_CAEEX|nr:hypothetical protein CEXT_639441 [Caerostris extrusa]